MKTLLVLTLTILAAAATAGAQTAIVPIVELKTGGLLGGVQNGRWLPPAKAATAANTEFVLVGWKGVEEGGVAVGKRGEREDVCEDFVRMELELQQDHGIAVGSSAKWNLTPRLAKNIDLKNPTYKTIAANFLKKHGISRPKVQITQAFRIDLEGDGVEEVLLTATHYTHGLSSRAEVGDYSFVMLRKTAGRHVTEHLLNGEFVTGKVEFGAPNQHEISAIADLNDDGSMEIVLHSAYYEGESAGAYEMKGGKPVGIKEFDIGCGV